MLLAAWSPHHGVGRVRSERWAPVTSSSRRFEITNGLLAVTPPHEGWEIPDGIVARPRAHLHPEVKLSTDALAIASGPIPQLPIYYSWSQSEGVALVCSDLEPLRALAAPKLNLRRVVALVAGVPDPWPGETVFAGIRRLPAGATLRFTGAGPVVSTALPECGRTFERRSTHELAMELREQLGRAIERATSGAAHVTVLVGGGLDSSGVLAVARERDGDRVNALAELWAAPGDDRPYLEALEQHLGVRAERRSARDAAPWFLPSLAADAQPQLWSGASHDMMLWSVARDRGADVTLGGYGGDIVFGGRPTFAPIVRSGHPLRAARSALALRVPWEMSRRARLRSWVVAPLLEPLVPSRAVVALRLRRLRAAWMKKPFLDLLEEALVATQAEAAPSTPDDWMARFANDRVFAELSMSWGAMASVTRTAPVDVLRDPELVRFVARVDPVTRNDGDWHRGLYRRALAGLVPEVVRLRNDKAAMEPGVAEAALASGSVPALESLGTLRALADLGLVEPSLFEPMMARWIAAVRLGERSWREPADECWRTVWQLLSVEQFLRRWGGAA